ncbi:MAG: hemerythrin domain-containing protein [Deltaproteobacteria bacterium]|nr:hemerythrin domain-containing protein [Deltaproteobacteria bacterium]
MKTDHFRQTHDELLQLAGEISKLLTPAELRKDATKARSLLSKLAGKLSVHLQMEDNSLFPSIEKYNDARLNSMLKVFVNEMGGLKDAFTKYTNKWANPDHIKNNAVEFINETKSIFNALAKRIKQENTELYKLIDELAVGK